MLTQCGLARSCVFTEQESISVVSDSDSDSDFGDSQREIIEEDEEGISYDG